jgi:hypothetical protein
MGSFRPLFRRFTVFEGCSMKWYAVAAFSMLFLNGGCNGTPTPVTPGAPGSVEYEQKKMEEAARAAPKPAAPKKDSTGQLIEDPNTPLPGSSAS